MFGAGPCRICPFDETTHRPGRAVPSAGTIKQSLDNGDNGEHSERHRHPRSHSVCLFYRKASPYTNKLALVRIISTEKLAVCDRRGPPTSI